MRFDTGTLNQRTFVFGSELDSTVSYRNRKFEFLTLGPSDPCAMPRVV